MYRGRGIRFVVASGSRRASRARRGLDRPNRDGSSIGTGRAGVAGVEMNRKAKPSLTFILYSLALILCLMVDDCKGLIGPFLLSVLL